MAQPVRVRGAAYLSAREFVAERFGGDALARVLDAVGTEDRAVIARATTSDQWEPFATWARFVETTDRLLGAGDLALAREGGRWAALEDLRRLYPDLARQGTPRDLLELASTFWRWYYDGGRAEAVAADEEEAALFEVIDFPAPNAAHCNRVLGWIGGAFAYIGVDVSIDMPMCRALGDERCLYVMRGEALRRFVTDPPI